MNEELGIDDAVNSAMDALEKDGLLEDDQEGSTTPDTKEIPEKDDGAEKPLTEDEDKPNEPVKDEAEKLIDPPASWRSDEKELFKNLPRDVQEIALRLQQASDSHFTQRSTELAHEKRAAADERQQYQSERARYSSELTRLNQMAAQLLPAKFQDIQTEADYLRLKATDPSRASEFEAFQGVLRMGNQQQQALAQQQQQEHLNREYNTLLEKHPEYRDDAKLKATLDNVRRTAVEYYGFAPQEVQVIGDHRYVDVINDAMQWRNYQANLKAAQAKKTVATPTKVLGKTATAGTADIGNDRKAALLKRARSSTNPREQADYISRIIG